MTTVKEFEVFTDDQVEKVPPPNTRYVTSNHASGFGKLIDFISDSML